MNRLKIDRAAMRIGNSDSSDCQAIRIAPKLASSALNLLKNLPTGDCRKRARYLPMAYALPAGCVPLRRRRDGGVRAGGPLDAKVAHCGRTGATLVPSRLDRPEHGGHLQAPPPTHSRLSGT